MKKILQLSPVLLLLFLFIASSASAHNGFNEGERVSDHTHTLSQQEIQDINGILHEKESIDNMQILVSLIPSVEGADINQIASQLLQNWKGKDDSKAQAHILIAKKDRKLAIATNSLLDAKISEADKNYMINEIIVPEFKSGRFAFGISQGIDAIQSKFEGREIVDDSTFDHRNYPVLSIFLVLILLSFLSGFVKNIKIKIALAIGISLLFWFLFGSTTYGILMFVLSLFPLLGRSARGGGGAYGGGYNEGTEGAGGTTNDSTFSLGGGSFSGGGASGDWRTFSFDTHKKFIFSDEQKTSVEQAIKDLELESSGEIVVYFARRSDSYLQGSWKLATTLGMIGLLTIMSLSYVWLLPPSFSTTNITLSIFLLMGMGLAISYFFPTVRLAFVPLNVMDHRIITKARDIFLQEEIFNTIDRTGILIYISELEKRVQVIGDKGINAVIEQDDWNKVLQLVTDGIKSGNPSEGLVAAIHECKKLLLDNGFIVREDDTNELADEMIIED